MQVKCQLCDGLITLLLNVYGSILDIENHNLIAYVSYLYQTKLLFTEKILNLLVLNCKEFQSFADARNLTDHH